MFLEFNNLNLNKKYYQKKNSIKFTKMIASLGEIKLTQAHSCYKEKWLSDKDCITEIKKIDRGQ